MSRPSRRNAWNDRAWNWVSYGPAIMAAVRAGVAVLGANLAREPMLAAMRDAMHDQRLSRRQAAKRNFQGEVVGAGPKALGVLASSPVSADRQVFGCASRVVRGQIGPCTCLNNSNPDHRKLLPN